VERFQERRRKFRPQNQHHRRLRSQSLPNEFFKPEFSEIFDEDSNDDVTKSEPELHRKAFRSRGDKMISQHDPALFVTENKNSMAEVKNPLTVLDPAKISPPISFKEPSSGLFNDDTFPSRVEMVNV